MIEKGRRHRPPPPPPPLARHEMLCEKCGVLGDEIHFPTVCLKFNNQRKILHQIVNNAVSNFENIDIVGKVYFPVITRRRGNHQSTFEL